MLKVGITGGIGSGKSTVCQIFSALGIPIYYADEEAKKIYFNNHQLKSELIQSFGDSIYISSNEINKPLLREIISNDNSRKKLNALIHPRVFEHFENWAKNQKSPYVIKEAAILFESGANKTVDLTIGILADKDVRLNRVLHRDQLSQDIVLKIMQTQIPQEELELKCNYLIQNDGNEMLIPQVLKIHQELLHQSTHF